MEALELTTILQLIDAHRAKAHDIWKSLSAILYHRDEASLYQYVHTLLRRQGLTTSLLSSNPTLLYAEVRHETTPTLLCYLNYDPEAPAFPQAQAITTNLLSLIIYQTILATKAEIAPITLKCFLCHKNFSHTLDFQHSIEQQPTLFQTDACLWYEPLLTERTLVGNSDNLILATGTKGYLSVELQVHTAHTTLHSHYGTIAPNAAWRLLWALNGLKDQHEEILIEGFYDTIIPLEDEALQQLANLPDTASTQAEQWGMPELHMGLQGKQMHYAHTLTPTCTINRLTSGDEATASAPITPSHHFIPATAKAIVDFYLVPGQDPADIFDKLKRHLHTHGFADIHVTLRYAGSPAYTPAHNSFAQQVIQSAEQVYGQSPIILPVLPEHVPIRFLTQNPATPGIILPLYISKTIKQAYEEEQDLHDSIAYLTYIMLRYAQ
jgi:hypothetical protein